MKNIWEVHWDLFGIYLGSNWDLLKNKAWQRTWGLGAAGTELQAPTGPPGGAPPPLEADAAGKAPALDKWGRTRK